MSDGDVQTTQKPTCLTCAAVAAVQYGHRIAAQSGHLSVPVDVVAAASELRTLIKDVERLGWSVADLQAVLVERTLKRASTSAQDLVRLRHAAKLIDLGARAALSERALDEVELLQAELHGAPPQAPPSRRPQMSVAGAR